MFRGIGRGVAEALSLSPPFKAPVTKMKQGMQVGSRFEYKYSDLIASTSNYHLMQDLSFIAKKEKGAMFGKDQQRLFLVFQRKEENWRTDNSKPKIIILYIAFIQATKLNPNYLDQNQKGIINPRCFRSRLANLGITTKLDITDMNGRIFELTRGTKNNGLTITFEHDNSVIINDDGRGQPVYATDADLNKDPWELLLNEGPCKPAQGGRSTKKKPTTRKQYKKPKRPTRKIRRTRPTRKIRRTRPKQRQKKKQRKTRKM